MKELDEARSKVKGILDAYDIMVADSDLGIFLDSDALKQSRIDQILNLKGENWKIAIINPQKSSTFNKQYKLVIWEGE